MKNIILSIFLVFCFFTNISIAQTPKECKKLLEKKIDVNSAIENQNNFLKDVKTLFDCYFDPIDYLIVAGPDMKFSMVYTFLGLYKIETKKKIRFSDLKIMVEWMKQRDEYPKTRKTVETYMDLMEKEASIANWQSDSTIFSQLGWDSTRLSTVKFYIDKNEKYHQTYRELFVKYGEEISRKNTEKQEDRNLKNEILPDRMVRCVAGLNAYTDFNTGLQKAKETSQNILIYFSAKTSANAREMENTVLINPEIQEIIYSQFIFIQLSVDDRTPLDLNEIHYSDALEKNIETKGAKNMEFELSITGHTASPAFLILDTKEKILAKNSFTLNIAEFKTFLLEKSGNQ